MSKEEPTPGLRDFMANSALSMLSTQDWAFKEPEYVAIRAYLIADAMLKERTNATNRTSSNT